MQAALGTLLVLSERQRDWLLVASLACLHGVFLLGLSHPAGVALLFLHLALCLAWQPLWRAPERLTRCVGAALAGIALLTAALSSQWLLCLWVALVIGVLGGQVFISLGVWQRTLHWLALLYLMVCLLLWTAPLVSGPDLDPYLFEEMRWFLGGLLVALLCCAGGAQFAQRGRSPGMLRFDIVYAALLFLLALVLALGSMTLRTHGQTAFLHGLVAAMLGLAAVLLVVNMLWEPRFGFAGLGVTFSRYLRTLGLALEQWLRKITALSEQESEPAEFLQAAVEVLLELPQVTGVAWIADSGYGVCGTQTEMRQTYSNWQLDITLYTDRPIGAALHAHFSLLLQVLAALYLAKLRESQLRTNAYLHAVHETGARLTHDVKNLLQSLKVLCAAALDDEMQQDPAREDPFRNLMQRQLPQIVVRLESTLEKLHLPARETSNLQTMEHWWGTLLQRYDRVAVEFVLDADVREADIPLEVFDGVADNLLQNALEKRKMCPGMHICVRAQRAEGEVVVSVADDGPAMVESRARQLFSAPVSSSSGFGVGLYQAARMAAMRGFRLLLAENRDGSVVFELRG
jgi:signal transduction histidine kinase